MENTEQPKTAPADIVKRLLDYRDEDGVASSAARDGAQEIERLRDLCGIAAFAIKNRQQADSMMSVEGLIANLEEAGRGEPPFATNGYPRLDEIIKSENTNTNAFAEQEKRTCTRCTYFNGSKHESHAMCCHPAYGGYLDPVFGSIHSDKSARAMRADKAPCGPDGRLFVAHIHLPR